ncbi:MAG: threonine synthase [Actinomycetota bacterium]|nr:threonine synthase [Actinomycetota bacterium]
MASLVSSLACPRCGARHDHSERHNVCSCGAPLLVDYDLDAVAATMTRDGVAARPPNMWRYRELLPVEDDAAVRSLGEGLTPLVPASALARDLGVAGLWVKDEAHNPTGTFKARGAACGIARARELGIAEVALPTAGNAGGAWAAYGAVAGIRVHVAMPSDAPEINKLECRMHGADLTLVDGLISDAARHIAAGIEEHGWFDASTLREPYRIEGKKTLGLEIAEQLGWEMPDAIVYPAGGGVGIIGIWRGLWQLRAIGWLRGELPRLIVVQPSGCAPIVDAFEHGAEASDPWPDAHTIAAGLRVPKALGDFLVLRAVRATSGTAVAVTDEAIVEAMATLARDAGIFAAPEGAATLAGAVALRDRGDLAAGDRVVLINTGTAFKYPEAMARALES